MRAKRAQRARRTRVVSYAALVSGTGVLVWGALSGWLPDFLRGLAENWVSTWWPWISAWMQTGGFGGAAAVFAASIAFVGVRHQARLNTWWQRAQWALEILARGDADDTQVNMALQAIAVIQVSRLAKEQEQEFLRAIVDEFILFPTNPETGEAETSGEGVPSPTQEPPSARPLASGRKVWNGRILGVSIRIGRDGGSHHGHL